MIKCMYSTRFQSGWSTSVLFFLVKASSVRADERATSLILLSLILLMRHYKMPASHKIQQAEVKPKK